MHLSFPVKNCHQFVTAKNDRATQPATGGAALTNKHAEFTTKSA
jgi:hypothetical protein